MPRRMTTRISPQSTCTTALRLQSRVQRDVEPELESKPAQGSLGSKQPSIFDEPLAVLDIYGASPVQNGEIPRNPAHKPTIKETARSRRASTKEDGPEEKGVTVQENLTTAYGPPSTPFFAPSERTTMFECHSTAAPTSMEGFAATEISVQQPVFRKVEQQSDFPVEGTPGEEPGRLDRPSTSYLGTYRELLAAPIEHVIVSGETTSEHRGRHDSVRQRVLTMPTGRQRKPSSAAPGIVAPSVQVPDTLKLPARVGKTRKVRNAVNVPPNQQHPPAPDYPKRDTPSWVKPDLHTPPPKPRLQPPPKRRAIRLRTKPKDKSQSVTRARRGLSPEIQPPHHLSVAQLQGRTRDQQPIQPFRAAAPGQISRFPGGTLQRPKSCRTTPRTKPAYPSHPITQSLLQTTHYAPLRRNVNRRSRITPSFAAKDNYCARLPPLVLRRGQSYSKPGTAHSLLQQNIYYHPPSAPVKRNVYYYYPTSTPVRRSFNQQCAPAPVRYDIY
jgi:hypothetical protein